MISNERKIFWDKKHKIKYQGKTKFNFLKNHKSLFIGKTVLEIGPGEGRQFFQLQNTLGYSIADISEEVLSNPIYDGLANKYLLENDYSISIPMKFDIIHFWYVVHHIKLDEISEFFLFLNRHLEQDGRILFNYPNSKKLEIDEKNNDGMKTTPFPSGFIKECYGLYFTAVITEAGRDEKHISVILKRND